MRVTVGGKAIEMDVKQGMIEAAEGLGKLALQYTKISLKVALFLLALKYFTPLFMQVFDTAFFPFLQDILAQAKSH